ncbi:hypothetical protein V2J09_005111, partial [Rumex salicifolius]
PNTIDPPCLLNFLPLLLQLAPTPTISWPLPPLNLVSQAKIFISLISLFVLIDRITHFGAAPFAQRWRLMSLFIPPNPSANAAFRKPGGQNSRPPASRPDRPAGDRPSDESSADRSRPQCQICKRSGHEASNCYQRLNLHVFPVTNRNAAARLNAPGKSPDYGFLKSFGCLCYPFLRPYNNNKLEYRSLPCVFLGYSSKHKGYAVISCPSQPVSSGSSDERSSSLDTNSSHSPPNQNAASSPVVSISAGETSTGHTSTSTSRSAPATPSAPPTPPSSASGPPPSSPLPPMPYPNAPTWFRPPDNSSHVMTTRSSTHSLKPKALTATKYPLPTALAAHIEPKLFHQAAKDPNWQHAMQVEFDALMKNGTWDLVPRPSEANVVGCKWIYRVKQKLDGCIDRYKARLVAKGFNQEAGVDYFDTFSPVVKPTTIRIVLSLAITNGWCLRQVDVNNAFLNGDLTETVFMDQPQGFIAPDRPTHVCRLRKALYGLKQAPRAWFHKLTGALVLHGFKACISDPSLFIKKNGSHVVYVLIYVDDLIIIGSHPTFIDEFVQLLNREFSLKDLGSLHYFLGIEVTRSDSSVQLSQQKYICDILERSKMSGARPISSPVEPGSRLIASGDPLPDPTLYRSVVGALQYVTITRPEISYAVNRVCQFMHRPTVSLVCGKTHFVLSQRHALLRSSLAESL